MNRNAINLALARRLWGQVANKPAGSYPNRESMKRHAFGKIFNSGAYNMKVSNLTENSKKEARLAARASKYNIGVGPELKAAQVVRDPDTGKKYMVLIRGKRSMSKNLRSALRNRTISFANIEATIERLASNAGIIYRNLRPNVFEVYRNHKGNIRVSVNNYGSAINKGGPFGRGTASLSNNNRMALNKFARSLGVNRQRRRQSNTPSAGGGMYGAYY